MADLERLVVKIEADTRSLRRNLDRAAVETNKAAAKMQRGVQQRGRQIERAFSGISASGGRVSGVLAGLGPVGIAAGAAFGAAALGIREAMQAARQAIIAFSDLANTSEKLSISIETLQELRFAAEQVGVPIKTLDLAMQRFTRRVGEAAQGGGELKGVLEQYNIAVRNADGSTRSTEAVLRDLADTIAGTENGAEQLRIAFKAFDSEGAALVNLLRRGSDGLDEFAQKARDAGVVVDAHIVRAAREAGDRLNELQRKNEALLNRIGVFFTEWLVRWEKVKTVVFETIGEIVDKFSDTEDLSRSSLVKEIEQAEADLKGAAQRLEDVQARIQRIRSMSGGLVPIPVEDERRAFRAREEAMQRLLMLQSRLNDLDAESNKPAPTPPPRIDVSAPESDASKQIRELTFQLQQLKRAASEVEVFKNLRAADLLGPKGDVKGDAAAAERIRSLTKQIEAQEGLNQMRENAQRITDSLRTTEERYRDQVSELRKAHEAGVLSSDEFAEAQKRLKENFEKTQQAAQSAAKGTQDALARLAESSVSVGQAMRDAAATGLTAFENALINIGSRTQSVADAFRDMVSSILKDLARLIIRQQITKPLASLFGSIDFGSIFGNLFGGGGGFGAGTGGSLGSVNGITPLAKGGPLIAGRAALVGEQGPELIVPSNSGHVVSNGNLKGAMASSGAGVVVNQVINISAGVAQTVRAEIESLRPRLANDAKAAVTDAVARGQLKLA